MRFGLIHRIMTGTLASLGILALVMSGKLHPVATALVLVGLVVGLFLPEHSRGDVWHLEEIPFPSSWSLPPHSKCSVS
jgi:hypothetical protein